MALKPVLKPSEGFVYPLSRPNNLSLKEKGLIQMQFLMTPREINKQNKQF